jgi:hypothetical protein
MRVYSHGCFVSFVVFARRKKIARPRGRAIIFQRVAGFSLSHFFGWSYVI